jgi:hypothetical protein
MSDILHMSDILPADPRARRLAIIIWIVAAIVGTVAIGWLSTYIDELTALARTDREASLSLFRTRVMPALLVVVVVAVAAGAMLLRQGVQIVRTSRFPLEGSRIIRATPARTGSAARALGILLAVAGFLLAAVPLMMISLVFWMLRQA